MFKALADPSHRELLDRLHAKNGRTLSELCGGLDLARQSVTQHLGVREDAGLISGKRQGREKLHYFKPIPIHEIYVRWIRKFEQQRLVPTWGDVADAADPIKHSRVVIDIDTVGDMSSLKSFLETGRPLDIYV